MLYRSEDVESFLSDLGFTVDEDAGEVIESKVHQKAAPKDTNCDVTQALV